MRDVTIVDVSPRDGLQNQANLISAEKKVKLIQTLIAAGVETIEAVSLVHPKKVPQMADAEDVLDQVIKETGFQPIALIPNLKGLERAVKYDGLGLNWTASATDTFNMKNIGMNIEQNLESFKVAVREAEKAKVDLCFCLSVSFGCPYEGKVQEAQVLNLVEKALEAGAGKINIADTIGIATPDEVSRLMKQVIALAGDVPAVIHLHDTRGFGIANAYAAYEAGVRIFETSASGIGGCPFAPGAAGNLATEDLVYLFERMGIRTGIHFGKLLEAADFAASLATKEPLGRIRRLDREKTIKELE